MPGVRWLTIDEAAARPGLSPPDVLAMVRSHRLSGVQADGVWRVPVAEVEALMRRVAAEPPTNRSVSDTLTKLGYVSDGGITNSLSVQYRVPAVNLEEYEIDRAVLNLVSKDVCEKHKVLPVSRAGGAPILAMADPTDVRAIDDIQLLTGFNVEPVVAPAGAILAAIERYCGSETG